MATTPDGTLVRPGTLASGERVVDVGCGVGFDSLIAARRVGAAGRVVGVDFRARKPS